MPGRTLAAFDDERGVDEDVFLACPATDPLGILGHRGAVLPPHRGVNDAVAQAPPPPPVAVQIRQGALRKEGDVGWPSLPPAVTTVPAATMVPATARRRQRRAAVALRRNAAKVAAALAASAAALAAGFLGSRQGATGTPGAGGDASLGTLALQAVPGAGSWADLMDADDAAAEKAAGLGAAALWGSQRAEYCVDIVGNAVHMPLGGRRAPPPGGCLYGHSPGWRRGGARRPWALRGPQPLRQWRTQGPDSVRRR